MKKVLTLIVSALLICAMFSNTVALAAPGGSTSATTSLTVSASEYEYGEGVYVTATVPWYGSGYWVGVYHEDDIPGDVDSIYWYYVGRNNAITSGVQVEIKSDTRVTYNSTRSEYHNLPVGRYSIYLFGDSGYSNVKATVTVEIVTPAAQNRVPATPKSISYTRTATKTGFADGTVTVRLDQSAGAVADVVLYWADSNGNKLSGYSNLQMQPVADGATSVTFSLVSNTLIPQGAKKLIAYASNSLGLSEGAASVTLDSRLSNYDFGTPLYEFQIVSDTHVTETDSHNYNKHFKEMLQDIVSVSPDSKGVIIAGDITDNGTEAEYVNVKEIYNSVSGAPEMYWTMGNHDFGLSGGNFYTETELFYKYSNTDSLYYDEWIEGVHYIFLNSEAIDTAEGVTATISDEQIAWLEEKLAEDYRAGKPIFVFLHQAVYNTVAGSLTGQGWDGIGTVGSYDTQESKLMAALAKYPEVLYFSGHSHWELNSIGTMYSRTDSMCTAFNTASVAYLWQSYNDTYTGGTYYDSETGGSQGYYVKVYEDKVLVLGRDFEENTWIPSAMFCVDYSELIPENELATGAVSDRTVALGTAGTSVSYLISSYKNTYGTSNVTVMSSGGTTVSSSALIATGMVITINGASYTVVVKGDVNSDGSINVSDADALLQYIRTGGGLTSAELDAAAEANGTESIDILTVTAILNELIG